MIVMDKSANCSPLKKKRFNFFRYKLINIILMGGGLCCKK